MAWKEITEYYARWDYVRHQGKIGIRDADGDWHFPTFSNPNEFGVVVDLLRNEKPVYWDEREWVRTSYAEEPGEEES